MGGGSTVLGDPYYSVGETVEGLSYACEADSHGCGNLNNASVNDYTSWSHITDGTTVSEFSRYTSHYKSSTWTSGGIAIASGHQNTTDPLPAKDVAFYYSTDTTDGDNGTWSIITPTNMVVAHCKKHSNASSYVGNRTSTISTNHVKLSGNPIKEGFDFWQSRNFAYVYNRGNNAQTSTDAGNIFDVITWAPISNVKGIRFDVRTKWYNGAYGNEKPHVTDIFHFSAPTQGINAKPDIDFEDDPQCLCYCDPKNISGNSLPDSSGQGYNFSLNSGGTSGTWTYNAGNGGHMTSSSGTFRNGNNVARSASDSFSYGGWFKINANDGGLIWYGSTTARKHCFIRNNIGVQNGFNIGYDLDGSDAWQSPHVEDVRIDHYVSNYGHTVGTTWHFFALRAHAGSGLVETSIDGKPFELQYRTNNPIASSETHPFGLGGDPHNDNSSSHTYGPFWFYDGLVPYWRIYQEWLRLKTRFGR